MASVPTAPTTTKLIIASRNIFFSSSYFLFTFASAIMRWIAMGSPVIEMAKNIAYKAWAS
jgi:hypothetical protein